MASVRRYNLASGDQRYEVRWRDAAGRNRSKSFTLRKDADLFAADVERRRRLGELYRDEPRSVGAAVAEYREQHARRVRPSTSRRGCEGARRARGGAD